VRALYHGDMVRTVSSRRVRRALSAMLLVVCGCQRYVELGNSPAVTRGDVRLTVSDETASVQYGAIGSNVRQVEGKIISASDSAITLAVTSVQRRTGFEESWNGESVSIPRTSIVLVEGRELSFSRTLATVGAVVAGGLAARGAIGGGEGSGSAVRKPGGGN
jgi:hypothetical protein